MTTIRCAELLPCPNLKKVFLDIENYVLAHQGGDAFDEIIKIIILKLYDEKVNLEIFPNRPILYFSKEARFKGDNDDDKTMNNMVNLFNDVKNKWPDIYPIDTKIDLKPHILNFIANKLEYISITQSGLDVLGEAYEALINPRIKGEKGQFFTPPHVVRMAVQMINPKLNHKILDPACGSGSFLIEVIKKVATESNDNECEKKLMNYVQNNIYGIDFDPRLVRVARSYMIIYGSNDNNIHQLDSLNYKEWSIHDQVKISNFDIILTNPPFAGKIEDKEILNMYELSNDLPQKKGFAKKTTREILFLEMCISLLKEGGILGIILPHGITNNQSMQYVREFIFKHGQLLAVISFDENMFRPYTSAKTCFVLFKKLKHVPKDYNIFFSESTLSGKNSKGEFVFSKDITADELKIIVNGKPQYIDSDLYNIIQQWRHYNDKQRN